MTGDRVMSVRDLRVSISRPGRPDLPIVRGVSFDVRRGRVLGVVGESGSGKSTIADALLRVNAENARLSGRIDYAGQDLVALPERSLRPLRGARIALIGQDPLESLNPVHRVGHQISEVFAVHSLLPKKEAAARTLEVIEQCGLPNPTAIARNYPHELSGGMRQRIAIAIALAAGPDVIVADEPTTSLDNTTQKQILKLLTSLCQETGVSLVFISHDLGVISEIADDLIVMYAGSIVELGPTAEIFASPRHHYTRALLDARPVLVDGAQASLRAVPGVAPKPDEVPAGCAFAERCDSRTDRCGAWPDLEPSEASQAHRFRCWNPGPAAGAASSGSRR